MEDNKEILFKGVKTVAIAIGSIILAPVLLTVGFKGIRLENTTVGYLFIVAGFIMALLGMFLLYKGVKYFLDYWFEK